MVTTRNPEQLREAARHVGYELWSLAEMSTRLAPARVPADDVLRNALIEGMLTHARNVIEFALGRFDTKTGARRWKHDDDIKPADFAPGWTCPTMEPARRLTERLPHIDKHLDHLSWARVESGKEAWEYPSLLEDAIAVMEAFVAHLRASGSTHAQDFAPWVQFARATRDGVDSGNAA